MKVALSRKRVYGLIAVLLVVCLSLSVFLSLQFSVNAFVQGQKSDPLPEAPATQDPTPTPSAQATDANVSNTPAPSPKENSSLMTEDEALSIAMPLIEQYTRENNRTITSVKATFSPSVRDIGGSRGGASLPEHLASPNLQWSSYPV